MVCVLKVTVSVLVIATYSDVFIVRAMKFLEDGHEIPCAKGQPVDILDYIPGDHKQVTLCYRCDCPNGLVKCHQYNRSPKCDMNGKSSKVNQKSDLNAPVISRNGTGSVLAIHKQQASRSPNQEIVLKAKEINSLMHVKISVTGSVLTGKIEAYQGNVSQISWAAPDSDGRVGNQTASHSNRKKLKSVGTTDSDDLSNK